MKSLSEFFGGVRNVVDRNRRRWVESTRNNMRGSKAMAPISCPHSPSGFMIVDAEGLVAGETPPEKTTAPCTQAIIVSLN